MKKAAALLLLLAACQSVSQPGSHAVAEARKDPSVVPDAEAPRRVNEDAGATANVVVTAPPLRWGKAPDANGELFTAIEGHCPKLGVSVTSNATFVHYAGRSIARVSGDGLEKVSTKFALTIGDVGLSNIQSITGSWPDAALLTYDNDARCQFRSSALRYSEADATWKPAFAGGEDVRSPQPYLAGAIGLRACEDCGTTNDSCKRNVFVSSPNVKVPPLTGDGFMVADYATLPTGEVFAVGAVCTDLSQTSTCNGQFRWWSPGAKVGWLPLASPVDSRSGQVLVRSKTEVIVSQGPYLGTFDGSKLTKLPAPAKTFGSLFDAGPDGFWVYADQKLIHRKPDGTYADISAPGSTPVGLAQGTPWMLAGNDIYKRQGGAWQKVAVPKPSFASSEKSYFTPLKLEVRAPDDVWIVAQYYEKQANWDFREVRTAILTTKRFKETLRCDGDSDSSKPAGFFASWPAAATDACKTPFLLLAPISATSPKNFDYPQTRAVLRPKSALIVEGTIREIRENGKVWIGVVPRSVADGRTLADLYAKHYPQSRAELLCVEANVTRTIPIGDPK